MEYSTTSDLPEDSLQIKQDDKFYSRLLSKESSLANPSFRVYYGVAAGAVPFLWESQPGTPKNSIPAVTLPPLTPPPSYQPNSKNKNFPRKYSLIHTFLPLLKMKKYSSPRAPPQSSLSLSLPSVSSYSSTGSGLHRRSRLSSLGSSFSYRDEYDDEYDDGSPTSTLCLGGRWRLSTGAVCRPIVMVKKALLTVAGHGSSRAAAAAAAATTTTTARFVN